MVRPPKKSIPIETRRPVQKNTAILSKMCSLELGKKSKKKEKKEITQLNIIFYPFAPPALLGRFVPFLVGRVTPSA